MTDNFQPSEDSLKTIFAAAKAAFMQYGKLLSKLWGFFFLTVTITNLVYQISGYELLDLFEYTFDNLHKFCKLIMDIVVFSWTTYLLEWLWYWTLWLCSLFLDVKPWWPRIIIPGWVTDVALISLALTSVFTRADLIVPRQDRAKAETEMTPELWEGIQRAEGTFWGPIHRFVDRINAGIWQWIDYIQIILTYPFHGFTKYSNLVRQVLIRLAGSILMWGFIRLIGYTINVVMAGHLDIPIIRVRRRFFKYFLLNLVGAIAASAMFIITNQYVLLFPRHSPSAP